MSAWAFTLCFDEAPFIAYWVRSCISFCDRVIVYVDVDSHDGTTEIAQHEGAEVRPYTGNGLDDGAFAAFASDAYREAIGQAEWVVWLDADELLYHPDMTTRLAELHTAGVNLPYTTQYTMSSHGPPVHNGQVYDDPDFRRGFHVPEGGKVAIFDPNSLAVRWDVGKHQAAIIGTIHRDDPVMPIKILHYRWLGEAYLKARDAKNFARLSQNNISGGMGYHVHPNFAHPYSPGWSGPKPQDAVDVI